MSPTRRDTLRIFGAATAVGSLRAQDHDHAIVPPPKPGLYTLAFFTSAEFAAMSSICDVIIPATNTPGALAAGVPAYIDDLVGRTETLQPIFRDGLRRTNSLARFSGKPFADLEPAIRMVLLAPWSDACDRNRLTTPGARFFRAIKDLTCDGYYESYQGLVQELGYQGNVVLAAFPGCTDDHGH